MPAAWRRLARFEKSLAGDAVVCGVDEAGRGPLAGPVVAAASIVAKVVRDRIMRRLDPVWPGYGFARHKGYSTPEHLDALARLGPCPLHRYSFTPVSVQSLALG